MRDYHDVKVLRGVSHVVAPRDPTQPFQLSDVELPLGGGVGPILATHVEVGLHDSQAKAAVFAVRGEDRACGISAKLLGARPRLVALSQLLATRLYGLAETDERVSDGTLAVLICSAVDGDGGTVRFPALLKLDPSDSLKSVTDTDPESRKRRVRYIVDHNSLPSKGERLQKCAFVRSVDESAEFEMLVVDRQRRPEVVSKFWIGDFLGAEVVLDAPERTKRLYRALKSARNVVEEQLDAAELAALDQVIDGAVVQQSVNLDNLMAGLPVPDAVRAQIDTAVSRTLPDREFDLAQDVARQFVRRRNYRGDNGLRLSVPSDFAAMVTVTDLEPGDDETRLRQVSFRTRTWNES